MLKTLLFLIITTVNAYQVLPWPTSKLPLALANLMDFMHVNVSFLKHETNRWDAQPLEKGPWKYDETKVLVKQVKQRRGEILPLNGSDSFVLNLSCDVTVSPDLCSKVRRGFENSAKRLTSALNVYSPIIIEAKFYPFSSVDASLSQTLGMAGATSLWSVSLNESMVSSQYSIPTVASSRWLVPQSLMKQIVVRDSPHFVPSWSDSDITAYFNSDYQFWFEGDGAISSQGISFELVATHEMVRRGYIFFRANAIEQTHGLGFDSSIYPYFSSAYTPALVQTQEFLTPDIYTTGGDDTMTASWVGWRPLRLFDRFVFELQNGSPGIGFADGLQQVEQWNVTAKLPTWLSNFLKSNTTSLSKAKYLYQVTVRGPKSVGFKSREEYVPLATFTGNFRPGTSISHLDPDTFTNTCDFLMTPSVQGSTGKTLNTLIQERCSNGNLGQHILAVLSTLGWTTKEGQVEGGLGNVIASTTAESTIVPTNTGGWQQPTASSDFWIKVLLGSLLGVFVIVGIFASVVIYKRRRVPRQASIVDETCRDVQPKEILSSRIQKTVKVSQLPESAKEGKMPPPKNLNRQAPSEVMSKSLKPAME